MDVAVTPDGVRYLALADRRAVPRPFVWRWLVPTVARDRARRWQVAAVLGVAGSAAATGLLAHRWEVGVAAGFMVAGLPSSRFNLARPVLVDAPALAFATGAAAAWVHGLEAVAVLLVLIAGCCKETAPVFAALFAWHPLLLVGLLAPAVRELTATPGPDVLDEHNAWILQHPFRASREAHRGRWTDGQLMLGPWGGAVVCLAHPTWQLAAVLAVAYAQLCAATDSVRLYQWAAPVVCIAAAEAVPVGWLPVLVTVTVLNPMRGDGI